MCAKEEIKMKVMVGLFTTESNANVPGKNEIGSYDLGFGDDCVRKLRVGEVFQAAGIDVIPSVYASAGASGATSAEPTFLPRSSAWKNRIRCFSRS